MSAVKIINIGETEIVFRASALLPRLYRYKFGRDIVSDLARLQKKWKKVVDNKDETEEQDKEWSALDLTVFEDVAWLMAKQGNPDIPDDPDEWLDSIDGAFSIYQVLPQIIELWKINQQTTSFPKKN